MASKTKYILIDSENVCPAIPDLIKVKNWKILVFFGENQIKLSRKLNAKFQEIGLQVESINICGNGPNALDFHIAFYLGSLSTIEQKAIFRVLSKDRGYDPLIRHLCGRGMRIARIESLSKG